MVISIETDYPNATGIVLSSIIHDNTNQWYIKVILFGVEPCIGPDTFSDEDRGAVGRAPCSSCVRYPSRQARYVHDKPRYLGRTDGGRR